MRLLTVEEVQVVRLGGPCVVPALRAAWNACVVDATEGARVVRLFVSKADEATYAADVQRPLRTHAPYKPEDGYVFSFNGAPLQVVDHWPEGQVGLLVAWSSPVWSVTA